MIASRRSILGSLNRTGLMAIASELGRCPELSMRQSLGAAVQGARKPANIMSK
jgi:hypothetical protein